MAADDYFHDLGGPAEGLALVQEIVERDWSSLDEHRRDDLASLGYEELEKLRASYRAGVGTFQGFARRLLPLRLRGLAAKVRSPENESQYDEEFPHGSLEGVPYRGAAARFAAETQWFGASALPNVAAVHLGELSTEIPEGDRPQFAVMMKAELDQRSTALPAAEGLAEALEAEDWAAAAEALDLIRRTEAFGRHPSMAAWLRSGEAPLDGTAARRLRRVGDAYADVDPEELAGASLQKLDAAIAIIDEGMATPREAVTLARTEPIREIRRRTA